MRADVLSTSVDSDVEALFGCGLAQCNTLEVEIRAPIRPFAAVLPVSQDGRRQGSPWLCAYWGACKAGAVTCETCPLCSSMITRCLPVYAVLRRPARPQHTSLCNSSPAGQNESLTACPHIRCGTRLAPRETSCSPAADAEPRSPHFSALAHQRRASLAEAPGWGSGRWPTRRCSARPRWSARSARRRVRARTCSGWPTACALPCFHRQARMLVTLPGVRRQSLSLLSFLASPAAGKPGLQQQYCQLLQMFGCALKLGKC